MDIVVFAIAWLAMGFIVSSLSHSLVCPGDGLIVFLYGVIAWPVRLLQFYIMLFGGD